jgi:hypothetical protein
MNNFLLLRSHEYFASTPVTFLSSTDVTFQSLKLCHVSVTQTMSRFYNSSRVTFQSVKLCHTLSLKWSHFSVTQMMSRIGYAINVTFLSIKWCHLILFSPCMFINTGYTQKNGAVSLYSPLKPHHSFVYTLYNVTIHQHIHFTIKINSLLKSPTYVSAS